MLSDRSARCKNNPILGGTVCHKHGGSAPQVRKAAQAVLAEQKERLVRDLVPKAVTALEKVVGDKQALPADKIRAATAILDRGGLTPGSTVEVHGHVKVVPPKEILAEAIAGIRSRLIAGHVYRPPELVQGDVTTPAEEAPGEAEEEPGAVVLPFVPDFI